MPKVFAWPPVAVQARYWTMEQPLSRSKSLLNRSSYPTGSQRNRLLAGFDIAGWPKYSSGYLEALWRYVEGGVHLFRLSSCRIPHGSTVPDNQRGEKKIDWIVPQEEIPWIVPDTPIEWFDGVYLTGSVGTTSGFPSIVIDGLPPNAIVAIPGEFVVLHETGETHMISNVSRSDANGVATITLVTRPSQGGQFSLGARETGAFELVSEWPKVMNRLTFPENYLLEFRQVFPDERGAFTEVNPWTLA